MHRPRVLVVDDDPVVRIACGRLLEAAFRVRTAADAIEALAALDEEKDYFAVVTDLDMPAHSGLWLLAQLRARRPAVRRVLHSGATVSDLEAHLRSGLVERFVAKPAEAQELLRALAE